MSFRMKYSTAGKCSSFKQMFEFAAKSYESTDFSNALHRAHAFHMGVIQAVRSIFVQDERAI